jgi:EpsI family protein
MEPAPSHIFGYAVLIFGLILFLVNELAGIIILQGLSLLPTIAGIIILLLGVSFMRILIIPLSYLIFMIPIWEMVTKNLHSPFQHFSASLAGLILKLLQVPAFVHGKVLELPNITLNVVKECSGVNYLISIIAIGIPLAFLFLKSTKKKLILILSAIIIAIFVNGFRVALIGIFVYNGIGSNLHGPFHIFQGMLVSLCGYVVLFGGLWILQRDRPGAPKSTQAIVSQDTGCKPPFLGRKVVYAAISVIILFIAVEGYSYFRVLSRIPLKANLDLFPAQIDGWEGTDASSIAIQYKYPGVDSEMNRTYRKGAETINLYIGYFEYQKQGRELIYYKTKELHSKSSKISLAMNPQGFVKINKAVLEERKDKKLILYWYELNGRIVTGRNMGKLYTIYDALVKGQTNGAVIMISTKLHPNEDHLQKLSTIKAFASETYPLLKNYLPKN